jgi:tRNA (cytidine/uridine-2'-O-)-methyltransferase
MISLALFEPDIAQNAGTSLRLCACLGLHAHLIEPAGFPASSAHFKRAGMDYLDKIAYHRHDDFESFNAWRKAKGQRLLLLTTKGAVNYLDFTFQAGDILMLGRESAGVPEAVHNSVDARLLIAMQPQMRSLNVAISGAMVAGEALRQLR